MLLSAMLTDIDDRYPNSATDAQVIRWINETIYRLYRDIAIDDIADVTTTADLALYSFPSGVIPENIKAMTISLSSEDADDLHYQRHLFPLGLNDPLKYNGWAKVDEETFMVYPTPSETGQVIRIYYQVQPPEYTTADTADDLTDYIRRDYLQAIEYGVLYTLCENNDDIQRANNYALRYNNELLRCKRESYNKDGKYPRTVDVMKRTSKGNRFGRRSHSRIYYISGDS